MKVSTGTQVFISGDAVTRTAIVSGTGVLDLGDYPAEVQLFVYDVDAIDALIGALTSIRAEMVESAGIAREMAAHDAVVREMTR